MYELSVARIIRKRHQALDIQQDVLPVVSLLGAGENNLNFLVKAGGKRFVFRIGMRPRLEANMAREFRGLLALPNDVGPKPLLLDKSKKEIPHVFEILSYVDGEKRSVWTRRELALHAKKLAYLHKKTFPYRSNFARKYARLDLSQKFERQLKDKGDAVLDPRVRSLLPKVRAFVRREGSCVSELRRFSLIHADACVDNILFSGDDVNYIDWEWIKIADPAQDVACFWYEDFPLLPWSIRLSRKDLDFFLKNYLAHRPDPTLARRVEVWNTYHLFMSMLYNLKRYSHYAGGKTGQPRHVYARAVKVMLSSLQKKFP